MFCKWPTNHINSLEENPHLFKKGGTQLDSDEENSAEDDCMSEDNGDLEFEEGLVGLEHERVAKKWQEGKRWDETHRGAQKV